MLEQGATTTQELANTGTMRQTVRPLAFEVFVANCIRT